MRVIPFPISMTVALEEAKLRMTFKDAARAIAYLLVVLTVVLALFAALVGILVLGVWSVRAQEVVGEHYDHLGHEFPVGVEGHCWKDGKSGYCFHGGHWAPSKPVVIMVPKTTPMYECPVNLHYHPLAKDVVPGDAGMWSQKDVKYADVGPPVLDGRCFTDDFDEDVAPRGRRITGKK